MTRTQYDGPMPLSLLEVKLRCLVFILDCLIVHQLTYERWFHRTLCKCVYIGPKMNPRHMRVKICVGEYMKRVNRQLAGNILKNSNNAKL